MNRGLWFVAAFFFFFFFFFNQDLKEYVDVVLNISLQTENYAQENR